MTDKIRQPIVTVAGHVDHGKTSILDCIAGTCIVKKEAGAITQKISFMLVPSSMIQEKSKNLLKQFKIELEVPGFLFIDTPGHAAFTNLRKRGGSLADLAILVIDINEGLMEQTRESIEILKESKVPFIVALNKVDRIAGWHKLSENLKESIELQAEYTKKEFENKLYRIISSLVNLGFDSDLFFRINNFKKQLALIPCSAQTGEGISELVVMLAGLSHKFLKKELILQKETKGTILEIKKEKGLTEIEAVLYDGVLNRNDILVIATLQEPVSTKMRSLFKAKPLKKGFDQVNEVTAAAGLKICVPTSAAETLVPGMPFVALSSEKGVEKAKQELKQDIASSLILDKEGIIIKAESLGSLEAMAFLLRKQGIKIKRAEIGNITKQEISIANASLEKTPLNAVILGFNVENETGKTGKVKIITGDVIYHIIEDLAAWQKTRRIEIEREKLEGMKWPAKIVIMKNCCFRQSKPAIFGVRIESGILKPGTELMNVEGEDIEKVKGLQSDAKSLDKADYGMEVAISMPNITFGRQIREGQILYSILNEEEFKRLKENKKFLTPQEINLLQEIAEIMRKKKATWGI